MESSFPHIRECVLDTGARTWCLHTDIGHRHSGLLRRSRYLAGRRALEDVKVQASSFRSCSVGSLTWPSSTLADKKPNSRSPESRGDQIACGNLQCRFALDAAPKPASNADSVTTCSSSRVSRSRSMNALIGNP